MEDVRTRFAPSPTGLLHIGGLRTALYAYLHARHTGGSFILRIEDTDRARLVPGALEDILDSLRWIGIDWDEGPDIGGPYAPYVQSERVELYRRHAERLVESGSAYPCFCTPERLRELREEQREKGLDPGYDRRCRGLTGQERAARRERGDTFVIRFAYPREGETAFPDLIRGEITTGNERMDDFVLLKSDGYPTYHLANVVDDHLMGITDVIRGEEWISSTPRHLNLYRSFGWTPPRFAHVPVILAPGGGKLSKRHGAVTVREFREKGYLPEALLNFIVLLGWSLDDRTEQFTMDQLVEYFDIRQVNKSAAVFSYEKLDHFNGLYIRRKTSGELCDLLMPFVVKAGLLGEQEADAHRDYLLRIVPLIRERITLLGEVGDHVWFFFDRHFEIRDTAALIPKKGTAADATRILEGAREAIRQADLFTEERIEASLRALVERLGMKVGQVFMTIRVAVTGSRVSPGLFETINVLGRERVLRRLAAAADTARSLEST
ncbi:MAG: glutamate--tRNA ligase [Spirochaetota bacterium]